MSRAIYILIAGLLSSTSFAVEEAKYKTVSGDGPFEIRDYEPCILAETLIDASLKDAGNQAFRPLFKYISGANTSKSKISMTAPVAQEKSGKGWAVSFMMPATNTLETLPSPENKKLKLRKIPARRVASVRYSGRWTEKKYNNYLKKLETWIEENKLEQTGNPIWARYNPPFTLWFLRRNEILIPIAKSAEK